jgi:transposase
MSQLGSVKQRRTTRPRDLPYGEEPLAVRWRKRQYRCCEQACPRKAFTESITEIPAGARLTGRLCRQLASQVASGRSVSAVAAQYRVGSPVTHRHCAAHADGLLTEPEPPVVLGIDETRRGKPKWIQDSETGRWGSCIFLRRVRPGSRTSAASTSPSRTRGGGQY